MIYIYLFIYFWYFLSVGYLVILQILGMSHRFAFIIKSNIVYGSLCTGFGLIQLGFCLLVKVEVLVLLEVM